MRYNIKYCNMMIYATSIPNAISTHFHPHYSEHLQL